MPSKQDERTLRTLKAENASLKRQIGRLRKKLGKFAPVEEEDVEDTLEIPKDPDDINVCPNCQGELTTLVTPNKSTILFCKQKCGFRKKQ